MEKLKGIVKEVYIPDYELGKVEPSKLGFIIQIQDKLVRLEQTQDEISSQVHRDDEVVIVRYTTNNKDIYVLEKDLRGNI